MLCKVVNLFLLKGSALFQNGVACWRILKCYVDSWQVLYKFFSWICCKWFTAMERDGPYCWCFGLSAIDFLWIIFDETGTLWTVGHWESSSDFFLPSVTTSLDIVLKYLSFVLFYFYVIRETPSSVLNLSIVAKIFLIAEPHLVW